MPSPRRWRKKPVVIEAFRIGTDPIPDWFIDRVTTKDITVHGDGHPLTGDLDYIEIKTLEGVMRGNRGDWAIQGVSGEIYPCKHAIFAATYEPVDESPPEGPR